MPSEDRVRQVKTTKAKHGEDHYKKIGSKGGVNSPTKFNSESAKKAARIRWDAVKNNEKGEQDVQA